jgi:hypothetical protein
VIGTLREGALHRDLKAWYRREGDVLELPVNGYVVDIVRGDLLVEIQTGGFAPLRRKLPALLVERPVRLVAPVPLTRRIVRIGVDGEVLSSRLSPKRGRVEDLFARLVSIPELIAHPAFELEVLLTHEEEHRVHRPGKAFKRHGWVVVGRSLLAVEGVVRFSAPEHFAALLPQGLPSPFDTSALAAAGAMPRRLAQQMAYCLRTMGICRPVGRDRHGVAYALAR